MSFVLRIVNDPARYESLDPSALVRQAGGCFFAFRFFRLLSSGVVSIFFGFWWMNDESVIDSLDDDNLLIPLSLVRPCEMMRWRMILSPDENDVNMSEKLEKNKTDCEWMTEMMWNGRTLRAMRLEKKCVTRGHRTRSWLIKSPGSSNVEYLYFQIYTHNTGTYNTMADEVMDTEMSEWVWAWWRW